MSEESLEVVGIDCFSTKSFVIYFSDDTFVRISAKELAECLSERERLPVADEA